MAREDDYKMAIELASRELAGCDFNKLASKAGAEAAVDGSHLRFSYYGRPVQVEREPIKVAATDQGPELPLPEQGLILHYLVNADGSQPAGEWITFREVPSGEFYWSAFVKRAKDPLVGFFGHRPELLLELAPLVGGRPSDESGDVSVIVQAFPRVPLLLVLWAGDEEFPPDGNVLLDRNIAGYLSSEDIALAAGLPIYKMMALARSRG